MDQDLQPFYYKYKSLNNIERFLDIIAYKRLYVPKYNELNDPMEGYYQCSLKDDESYIKDFLTKVHDLKSGVRILSLTTSYDNFLMWSHYCDGHKGVCIKLQVRTENEPHKVIYDKHLPTLTGNTVEDVENVLCHKSPLWFYEDEVRYFKRITERKTEYLNIKISDVYFGAKAKDKTVRLLTKVITQIDKNIKCHKLKMEDLKATSGYDFNL